MNRPRNLVTLAALFCILLQPSAVLAEGGVDFEANDFSKRLEAAAAAYAAGEVEDSPIEVGTVFAEFEASEIHVRLASEDAEVYKQVENRWLALWQDMKNGKDPAKIQKEAAWIGDQLIKAASDPLSIGSIFIQGLIIILREGFEALLIIGAIIAYLKKTENKEGTKRIWAGAGLAVALSLVIAVVLKLVLTPEIMGSSQEILEGITMLVAAGVLFWCSHWLISKSEGQRWMAFIRGKAEKAISSGNLWILASLSFFVVFREGIETVLFYQAWSYSAVEVAGGMTALWSGFLVGVIGLVVLYIGIEVLGVRIPLRAFFTITGSMLYFMAFRFAGTGIRELQEGGVMSMTSVSWLPDSTALQLWLGFYPNTECIIAQSILIIGIVVGLIVIFRTPEKNVQEAAA